MRDGELKSTKPSLNSRLESSKEEKKKPFEWHLVPRPIAAERRFLVTPDLA